MNLLKIPFKHVKNHRMIEYLDNLETHTQESRNSFERTDDQAAIAPGPITGPNSEYKDIWQNTLSLLESKISKASFETWIKATVLIKIENDEAVIAVKNEFTRNFLIQSYSKVIRDALKEILALSLALRIIIEPSLELVNNSQTSLADLIPNKIANQKTKLQNSVNKLKNKLNQKYNFANYSLGKFNASAITFAKALIENSTGFYNSLYIYSAPGMGKSHLLHAIGNHILEQDSDSRVKYIKAEEFTNELIIAIQKNQTQEFKNQYRNLDLLLVDDFHFFEGKKACQDELLHTFDALVSAGARIVIASHKSIEETKLSSNLANKLKASLMSNIKYPSFEERLELLTAKAKAYNKNDHSSIIETICRKSFSSIREIEAVFHQALAHQSFSGEELSTESFNRLFGTYIEANANKGLSIETIIKTVAEYFSLSDKELKSKSRVQDIVRARHIAIYLSYQLLEISYGRIGEYFGGRKHSSIIHSIQSIEEQLNTKLPSAVGLKKIIEELRGQII